VGDLELAWQYLLSQFSNKSCLCNKIDFTFQYGSRMITSSRSTNCYLTHQ